MLNLHNCIMKFGAVPLKDALGATAVHSIRQGGLVLKKCDVERARKIAQLGVAAWRLDRGS